MKNHYSKQYCIGQLIEDYCTDEWKFLIKESEEVMAYEKGVTVIKEGEVANRIIILKKGKVKVFFSVEDKKEQILRLVSDKQIIGHRAFGGSFKHTISATTLTECEIVNIPLKLFLSVLKANSIFCFHFMMFFAEELKNTEQHFKLNKAKNLDQRVASAILDNLIAFGYSPKNKQRLAYTISRKDYASLSNTTYESIVRSFKKFSDMGLLKIVGKELDILNEEELLKISTLEY